MSKDIVIQEGGVGRNITVDKLKTAVVGGGDCLWVPEDEVQLGEKTINENGTYMAADDGLYGYSQVTVSGVGTVTGIDPATGNEVEIHRDPETGEIVETVLPAEIRVVMLPSKTTYDRGETIDYSGIIVHWYSTAGEDMGEVPYSELVFPKTIASGGDDWTDGQGLNAIRLYYTPHYSPLEWNVFYISDHVLGKNNSGFDVTYGSYNAPGSVMITRYNDKNYAMSMTQQNADVDVFQYDTTRNGWRGGGSTTAKAVPGSFKQIAFEDWCTDLPVSTVDPLNIDPTAIRSVQTLPVQWARYGDGAILETSFEINVNDAEPI